MHHYSEDDEVAEQAVMRLFAELEWQLSQDVTAE
jgi:hypothetical protein